ncbi:hypothetical protein DSAG12_02541 [Promethearchaeum syntrophicum]|uniref:Uncharacterized protein n=1 Tax=Promethearchaeum syntrophicum TaxID=2594042 RepID=A0A5B9DCE6_9ARCH|nr:hypothetical protein [Candidatus Prometheoarchaeum syntrophicum]QEE16711.1 hypothetical protein DSAG12_02541 [Candidatus Prometheoarchaeum syntrophicum]
MILQDIQNVFSQILGVVEKILPVILWSMGIILAFVLPLGIFLKNILGAAVNIFPGPETELLWVYFVVAGIFLLVGIFLAVKYPERKIKL